MSNAAASPTLDLREKRAARESVCAHCLLPLPLGTDSAFCCRGCEEVHALLQGGGLARYYELGGGEGHPIPPASIDRKWLEPIASRLAEQPGLTRVVLDVQGIHCAACVWLFEELFKREKGSGGILVNPAVGSVEMTVAPEFPIDRYVGEIESFGYRLGPPLATKAEQARRSDPLVWRMGVSIAIAMNTMIFGIAIYAGLAEGRVYRLFHALDFTLSIVSVLIGGTVFFRSAWQALRRRVLHLDLPIALGIILAFASSTYTYFTRGGSTSYFDTLNVFIALMLVGRFLQERVLAKNRAYLLASNGAEGLLTRRVKGNAVELVKCTEIHEGDVLLIGHQDLVPVDATLMGQNPGLFSLDWINGESVPRSFGVGERVPAGAFCQDPQARVVRATTAFDASTIVALLRTTNRRDDDLARSTPWWKRFTSIYVVAVVGLAVLSFAGWMIVTGDLGRTLDVAAGLLIVTCPCAFGIATPLAYELAQAALRRVGLFVRTPGFLDRAAEVDRVVFDKTGTLTTGALVVSDTAPLARLSRRERNVAYALAVRSSHPKSRAIAAALGSLEGGATFTAQEVAEEVPGKGLEMVVDQSVYRLGAPSWAARVRDASQPGDVVFSRDGKILASITTTEELRPGAAAEVKALREAGYDAFVVSGDSPEATKAIAASCGLEESHAFGARSPEGKASWLRDLGPAKTLFVGDGINDSLVAEESYCAGTPAIDRPFMAARCDFYFVSPGLGPVRSALRMAKRLASVVRMNLAIAIFYNVITVSLAVAGLMTPLVCAVLMPVSSLCTVLATTARLAGRRSA
ncbi:MAG: HAD-IC family P-type ATPase [Deltaproteobacteria bacterium]|nr:HAD-IC family P-type ATPase [Deltaproteobacteria bacterium]